MEQPNLIGRKAELKILDSLVESKKPEFVVLYGRRRVGKTFLVKQFFSERFSFYSTGVISGSREDKLNGFHSSLKRYGCTEKKPPRNWFEAFDRLRDLLEKPYCYREGKNQKRVVFLDELPWMDSHRSDFKAAFDFFWNTYGSTQSDLILLVCGSATSWIINNIVKDTGGFYNRLTNQIHLMPFHLKECKAFCLKKGLNLKDEQILRGYMVFGGIPYYWDLLNPALSLDQNIQNLCFEETGQLRYEYGALFHSLFSSKGEHRAVIEILAKKKDGVLRNDFLKESEIRGGRQLTETLEELEQCGFIRKYRNQKTAKSNPFYQIIDPFVRFAITFLNDGKVDSWMKYIGKASYFAWTGNSFELLCLNHIKEIKEALSIGGVDTREYSFRSKKSSPGAQIDLCIDRADGIIDICEMKYTEDPFPLDESYLENLRNKISVFRDETKTDAAIHLVMISAKGVKGKRPDNLVTVVLDKEIFF